MRDADAVPALIALLRSPHPKVKARVVGALHNLSSDSGTIRIIRRNDGILQLVDLLRYCIAWSPSTSPSWSHSSGQ